MFHERPEPRFRCQHNLSVYFGALEEPRKNPVEKKINETHKHAKAVAEKVCGKEKSASFVAQEKALTIWEEFSGDRSKRGLTKSAR